MATVHVIGQPDNAFERKVIRRLARSLPEAYHIFHNFELSIGHQGFPYEYDLAVVGDYAVYHVEVKGYRGTIRGNAQEWLFDHGGVYPSPIPLANKKSKILSAKLRQFSPQLAQVFVDTLIVLADEKASVQLCDDQAYRVLPLWAAARYMTDRRRLPVSPAPIGPYHETICEALFGTSPARKIKQIGLYDIVEKINQTESRTVFLATHRYIQTFPKTILKVYHFDPYAEPAEQERQIRAIFHAPEALRMLSAHPNILQSSDMFAWEGDTFVLPTEYLEQGRTLEAVLEQPDECPRGWATQRDLIAQVARGLQHAHQAGVIHRDIRPLSVVVAPDLPVKLVNFDLAFLRQAPALSSPWRLRQRLHPVYTAPEVWRDPAAASAASDVYSLGLLFYTLLTRTPPVVDARTVLVTQQPPINLTRLKHALHLLGSIADLAVPDQATGVIQKMCAVAPQQRYATMDAVLEELYAV